MPLKWSYDKLGSENLKCLFLVCCMFPEDCDIPVEDLTRYAHGLNKIEVGGPMITLEQIRNRVVRLVGELKDRFLLLDGWDNGHVKMHDVVRDVAKFTATREPLMMNIDWNWADSKNSKVIRSHNCSNLRLLVTEGDFNELKEDNIFGKAENLNVLCIRSCNTFTSLPQTAKRLKNLRTLHLIECRELKSISAVGELTSLEILCCRRCSSIEELPVEIGELKRTLRLLELYDCSSLRTIAAGILSKLVSLEELIIKASFGAWEGEEKGRNNNACIKELESLVKLTWLEINAEDANLANVQLSLSSKIYNFDIVIGGRKEEVWYLPSSYSRQIYDKRLKRVALYNLSQSTPLGNWISIFMKRAKEFIFKGNVSNYLEDPKMTLKCDNIMTTLIAANTVTSSSSMYFKSEVGGCVFPVLEHLELVRLPNIEKICDGESSNSLRNIKELRLKSLPKLSQLWPNVDLNPNTTTTTISLVNLSSIGISDCDSLQNLFPLSAAISHLEYLHISGCKAMQQVFDTRSKYQSAFSNLKYLIMKYMPNLTAFCKGAQTINFPRLERMDIGDLPKLKSFIPLDNSESHTQHSFHIFCNQKVAFGSLKDLRITGADENIRNLLCPQIQQYDWLRELKELHIRNCKGVRNAFVSPIITVRYLVNLRSLRIQNCPEMIQVIGDAEVDDHEENDHRLFPSLEEIELKSLPKLERFVGPWKYPLDHDHNPDHINIIELPSLRDLYIVKCDRLKRFTTVQGISLTTPNLGTISIDYHLNTLTPRKDVNGALELHHRIIQALAAIKGGQEIQIESILVSNASDFLVAKDGAKTPVSNLVGRSYTILLYFSGASERDSSVFLPKLVEAYQEIREKGSEALLEMIFVPCGIIYQESFDRHYAKMPWLAVPFVDYVRTEFLRILFGIRSETPMVVAIGPTGKTITTRAKDLIMLYGARAYPFTEEHIKEIEAEDDKMVEGSQAPASSRQQSI